MPKNRNSATVDPSYFSNSTTSPTHSRPRNSSITPPLRGSRRGSSRMAKADPVGGRRRRHLPTAESHLRDAAFAPHRLDCGHAPLSRRLPLKGGVITVAPYKASVTPRRSSLPAIPPKRPLKHSSITPPLRGSRRSPSRMAKASAVGGQGSQRRDLVRRRGQAPAKLMALKHRTSGLIRVKHGSQPSV